MNTFQLYLVGLASLVALLHVQPADPEPSPLLKRSPWRDYEAPQPGTYTLPVVKEAADGEVLDSRGHSLRLGEAFKGRVTVMSFIYTRCADATACPYATGILNELHRISTTDAELAKDVGLVSMSFDPVADTPQRMAEYAKVMAGRKQGSPWRFLTTASPAALEPILKAYDQAVSVKKNPADPAGPLNHTLRVYLIDREGRIRNIYSSGTLDLRLVLADVRTLLREAPARPSSSS
ncbi:protein SCO1/2 [Roseimicrobium gellanilyticum]|uniref:Protein SCO1/2 n=1 Tax=Roseimicrobium gellanilyticum TaxID=748857 RepID=A0A366HD57_9BACT|nr:SCO family protein [Roseimicrobium gellanilyticum]RBP39167.1 protein SCO1/2 [Roseimicrobium gellanilyticum]